MTLTLVVLALAIARLTRLITTDTIFENLRDRFWRRFPPGSSRLGYLLTCNWCMSIYVASLVIAGYMIAPGPTFVVSTVLAMSMFTGLLLDRVG